MLPMLYILENNQQVGPLQEGQVVAMLQQGRISAQTPCWAEGMAGWLPLGQAFPQVLPAAPVAPPPPPGGSTTFEVEHAAEWRLPKLTLVNEEVIVEAGALHYMKGHLEIDSQLPSVGGFLKSALTKERAVRPRYRGTGTLWLEPTFADVNLLELKGEAWVLDKGAFLAADRSIEVGMFTNSAMAGIFGGDGFFQTQVSGHGKLLYLSPGPVQRIELDGTDTLTVDGSFAVARTASLEYEVSKATKGLFSSLTSGEGLVNRFRGRGTVLLAPVPNRYHTIMGQFGGLHAAIARISKG